MGGKDIWSGGDSNSKYFDKSLKEHAISLRMIWQTERLLHVSIFWIRNVGPM